MKKVSLGVIFLAIVLTGHAQTVEFQDGDKQFEITLNPLFDYFGSLFTENGAYLNLNSGSLVYRKFLNDKKARRYQLGVFAGSQQSKTVTEFSISEYNTDVLNIDFGIGTDFHYPKNSWNFYGGYQLNFGVGYDRYFRSSQSQPSSSTSNLTEVERSEGWRLSVGPEALGGLQYHFNSILYTGIELRAYLSVTYNTPKKTMTRLETISSNGNELIDESSNESDGYLSGIVSSQNLILFKMGAKF